MFKNVLSVKHMSLYEDNLEKLVVRVSENKLINKTI